MRFSVLASDFDGSRPTPPVTAHWRLIGNATRELVPHLLLKRVLRVAQLPAEQVLSHLDCHDSLTATPRASRPDPGLLQRGVAHHAFERLWPA